MKRVTRELREYRNALDRLGRAWKDPHFGRCARCRTLSFLALLKGEAQDIRLAIRLVLAHARTREDYGAPKCDLEGCVFHEELTFPLARRMLKLHLGEMGGRDGRGRKLGTFDLFLGMPQDPMGTVFLRYPRHKVVAHLWIEPPEEGAGEVHPLESIARGWDLHFKACRDGCLEKYREARDLARADLELEPARKWELRAPFSCKKEGS